MRIHRVFRTGLGYMQWLLLGLVLILATGNGVEAADKFKDFKLKNLAGETVRLENYTNKALLVAFFFPTCTYCNQAFPETVWIYDKYKDQGLSMVWINIVEEEEGLIPDWLAEHEYTVPILIGASQQYLARRYDLQMTPQHFIVNSDREILFRQLGYKDGYAEELENHIRQALNLAP